MRRLSALIFAALLAAPAIAQESKAVAALSDALSTCQPMFENRRPLLSPAALDRTLPAAESLAERRRLTRLAPPSEEHLRAAGWDIRTLSAGTMMAVKTADWGRISLMFTGGRCSVNMTAPDNRLPDGPALVATAETWIANTYPSAARDPNQIVPPESGGGSRGGEPTTLTRSTWRAPDGMAISMNVSHAGPDTRPVSLMVALSYSGIPRLPR